MFFSSGEKQYSFEEFIPIVKQIAKDKDTGTLQDFNLKQIIQLKTQSINNNIFKIYAILALYI
jgi:hypothetical protein